MSGPTSVRTQSSGKPCAYDQPLRIGRDDRDREPELLDLVREAVPVPDVMVLGRRAQHDLVAPALMDEVADRARGIPAAVDELDCAPLGGALDEAQRILRGPIGSVGVALGRDHQDEVATPARPPLDLLEQMRRRLGAIGDDEQSDSLFSHAHMERRAEQGRITRMG